MKKRRKMNREQLAFLVMLTGAVLALWIGGLGICAEASEKNGAGSTHILTLYDTRYNEGPLMVGYFEIDGGIAAMCICHEMNPPTKVGTALTVDRVYSGEGRDNGLMRKVRYYGWRGPGDIGASYVETCLAGSVANGHDDNYYGYGQAFIDRIKELPEAPRGFNVYVLSDGISTNQELAYWDYQPTGWLKLKKTNTEEGIAGQNGCYTLKGSEYGVFTEESCNNQVAVLTTDEDGNTGTVELDSGTYYIKEIKAPEGYRLDPEVHPVTVEPQKTRDMEVGEVPVWDSLGLTIRKVDAESGRGDPRGAASLEGAEFQVCYYKGYYTRKNLPEKPERTWRLETKAEEDAGGVQYICRLNEAYRIGGDAFYEADGQTVLPLGTITVEEVKAPKGYLLKDAFFQNNSGEIMEGKYLTTIRQDGEAALMDGGNVCAASDYVIRGDLEFVKIADGTHERLAGIPFQITSESTGESHVIVTDENGQASTASAWNLHSQNTNLGETCEDGIWFGMEPDGTFAPAEDSKGALPYDTYSIEEIRCENNEGYDLIPPFKVTIKKNHATVHLGTLTDDGPKKPEEPEDPKEPEEPDKPKEPEEPEEPDKPETPGQPQKPVRTGDVANISIWLFVCILSCVVMITCGMIARRMKKGKR